nr:hypothetical protein [uncultured Campylobacter sp.]
MSNSRKYRSCKIGKYESSYRPLCGLNMLMQQNGAVKFTPPRRKKDQILV